MATQLVRAEEGPVIVAGIMVVQEIGTVGQEEATAGRVVMEAADRHSATGIVVPEETAVMAITAGQKKIGIVAQAEGADPGAMKIAQTEIGKADPADTAAIQAQEAGRVWAGHQEIAVAAHHVVLRQCVDLHQWAAGNEGIPKETATGNSD